MPQPIPAVHIEILEPRNRAQVPAGHSVLLRASASVGSDDLGAEIRWRSNRDGFIGQGTDLAVQLTAGKHKLRAAVGQRAGTLARSSQEESQACEDSQTDSDDSAKDDHSAKDVVEVYAVPVDYPGGDT